MMQKGLGIIEIVVVIAVIVTVFAGILQLSALESRVQERARDESGAYLLAREALEAARFVRDEDWDTFAGLLPENAYYPVMSGSAWTLDAADPGPVLGFSRRVILHEVLRDGSDTIAPVGSPDDDTRRVEAIVEWTGRGGSSESVTLETYLTNWQAHL